MQPDYASIVARRRSLRIDGYMTLADVGFDGDWVTPYQMASRSMDGPVLVAQHWLDAQSIELHRTTLEQLGYLPHIRFNRTLDIALAIAGMARSSLYMTQAFQLIPLSSTERISRRAMDESFDQVTVHELTDRPVIALGAHAVRLCTRHGIEHVPSPNPSRRGHSNAENARELALALAQTA